jgi:hypothetical protein
MMIRALVQSKVMLILVDSGNSHSFVNESFIQAVGITTVSAPVMQVRVANRERLASSQQVKARKWWSQGHTFYTDMRVLQLGAYDIILGYDWLKAHIPMVCRWELQTLEF